MVRLPGPRQTVTVVLSNHVLHLSVFLLGLSAAKLFHTQVAGQCRNLMQSRSRCQAAAITRRVQIHLYLLTQAGGHEVTRHHLKWRERQRKNRATLGWKRH